MCFVKESQLHDMQIVSDNRRSLGSDSGCLDHGFAASPRTNSFFGNHLVSNCGPGTVLWNANWVTRFGI